MMQQLLLLWMMVAIVVVVVVVMKKKKTKRKRSGRHWIEMWSVFMMIKKNSLFRRFCNFLLRHEGQLFHTVFRHYTVEKKIPFLRRNERNNEKSKTRRALVQPSSDGKKPSSTLRTPSHKN